MTRRPTLLWLAQLAWIACSSIGCSGGTTRPSGQGDHEPIKTPEPTPRPIAIDAGPPPTPPGAAPPYTIGSLDGAGSIAGRVSSPPLPAASASTSACGTQTAPGLDRSHSGAVTGALVFIDGIRAGKPPGDARPVDTGIRGCRFEPHLALLPRLGAELAIHNDDPIRHEIVVAWVGPDGASAPERLASIPMPLEGQRFAIPIDRPGLVRLECALHPGEIGWAFAPPHPYHAVSGTGGRFELDGVAPGRYEVVAWHPPIGGGAPLRASVAVEVKPGEETEIELVLAAPAAP
jgi:hypothetical protein